MNTGIIGDIAGVYIPFNEIKFVVSENDKPLAFNYMKDNNYNFIPIIKNKRFVGFFYSDTVIEGCELVNNGLKKYVISESSTLGDVLRKFKNKDIQQYVVCSEEEVVGLISYADLKDKKVLLYMFKLIIDIEINLSSYFQEILYEESSDNIKQKLQEISKKMGKPIERYEEDKENNVSLHIINYLDIKQLLHFHKNINRINEKANINKLKPIIHILTGDNIKNIGKLRNIIAHPNKFISHIDDMTENFITLIDLHKKISDCLSN